MAVVPALFSANVVSKTPRPNRTSADGVRRCAGVVFRQAFADRWR